MLASEVRSWLWQKCPWTALWNPSKEEPQFPCRSCHKWRKNGCLDWGSVRKPQEIRRSARVNLLKAATIQVRLKEIQA